jgi:hypothetical protein
MSGDGQTPGADVLDDTGGSESGRNQCLTEKAFTADVTKALDPSWVDLAGDRI